VLRQLHVAQDLGARAVLVSPMLIGLPAFWELCQEHAAIPVIAHPSFGGVQRFAPEALFGRLLRLFGADAVIYVNFGSRFARSRESCRTVAERLLEPWDSVLPALPVPAGGIAVESAREMIDFYGTDTMLLVGGSLQVDPTPAVVAQRCRTFVEAARGAD
jgi:ribulose-bisphosphate carboxylase large chain